MSFSIRVLITIVLIVLLQFYFYRKLKKSSSVLFPNLSHKKLKKWYLIVSAFINIYPLLMLVSWLYYIIAGASRPRTPENIFFEIFILFPFWIAALTMIQSMIYFLVTDIIRLFILPLYRKHKEKIRRLEAKILLAIIVFFVIYTPVRIAYDYFAVSVRPVEFVKKDLPPSLNNLRIVFISDIQADRYTNRNRLDNYISKVNEANPDLVLIAGDIVTGTPDYIDLAAEYIGKIKSKYGVYSCVGDHDNWAYREDNQKSIREITNALAKYDVKMINNKNIVLDIEDSKVEIAFATHTYAQSLNPDVLLDLVNGGGKFDLKIFLTHQPREHLILAASENHYDLFLAGHTHGGQISLLFPFINLSPTLIETRFVRGTFQIDNMMAIVTRGLGMSLVPMRFNSTPEITVINLHFK